MSKDYYLPIVSRETREQVINKFYRDIGKYLDESEEIFIAQNKELFTTLAGTVKDTENPHILTSPLLLYRLLAEEAKKKRTRCPKVTENTLDVVLRDIQKIIEQPKRQGMGRIMLNQFFDNNQELVVPIMLTMYHFPKAGKDVVIISYHAHEALKQAAEAEHLNKQFS